MAHILAFIADQAAQSDDWTRSELLSLASIVLPIAGGIYTWVKTRGAARINKEAEKPFVTLEDVEFDSKVLEHTVNTKITVYNRSSLADAIKSVTVKVEGVDIKPFMEKQVFICNLATNNLRPELTNQKQWPHAYPVHLAPMSPVTFITWFFAQDLSAHRMYPPEGHPVVLKVVLTTLRGQTLERKFIYARAAFDRRESA